MEIRNSTLNHHITHSDRLKNARSKIDDTLRKITDGKEDLSLRKVGTNANFLMDLQNRIAQKEAFHKNSGTINLRLQAYESSLDALMRIADKAKSTMIALAGENGQFAGFTARKEFEGNLSQIQTALNANVQGDYIFGGTRTDQHVVDISRLEGAPVDATTPNYDYFLGNHEKISGLIDEQDGLEYGLEAGDSSIEKLIRAIKLASSEDIPQNRQKLAQAQGLIDDAFKGIVALNSTVAQNQVYIEQKVENLEHQKDFLQEHYNEFIAVDLAEALTYFSTLQSILSASYSSTSKANGQDIWSYM